MASSSRNENKLMRRRLANAYLSSVISISLVLLLVGVSSLLLVNTRSVSDYFKENVQVSVIMKQEVPDNEALEYKKRHSCMAPSSSPVNVERKKWRICSAAIS